MLEFVGRLTGENINNSSKFPMVEIYKYLLSKYPNLLTRRVGKDILKCQDPRLNEYMLSRLQSEKPEILKQLYREVLGKNRPPSSLGAGLVILLKIEVLVRN